MNNLKHNLPGKATSIIDNSENINKTNNEKIIKEKENYNNNDINNFFLKII